MKTARPHEVSDADRDEEELEATDRDATAGQPVLDEAGDEASLRDDADDDRRAADDEARLADAEARGTGGSF